MKFNNDTNFLEQHFLKNEKITKEFIDIAEFHKNDIVIEIGPGKGVFTKLIAPQVKKLYCYELDTRLKPYLDEIIKEYPNTEVIYNDILKVDVSSCDKIITSLPFNILEHFIAKLLKWDFKKLIMIIGKKYADSVINEEITNLSLLTNCFFNTTKVRDIAPNEFEPSPRVMTSVVVITPKSNETKKEYLLFKNMYLLNHKKIKNSLIESLIKIDVCKTKREAKDLVNSLNLSPNLLDTKFEVISNEELKELYNKIKTII